MSIAVHDKVHHSVILLLILEVRQIFPLPFLSLSVMVVFSQKVTLDAMYSKCLPFALQGLLSLPAELVVMAALPTTNPNCSVREGVVGLYRHCSSSKLTNQGHQWLCYRPARVTGTSLPKAMAGLTRGWAFVQLVA